LKRARVRTTHVLRYQRFQHPSCFQTEKGVTFDDGGLHFGVAAGSVGLFTVLLQVPWSWWLRCLKRLIEPLLQLLRAVEVWRERRQPRWSGQAPALFMRCTLQCMTAVIAVWRTKHRTVCAEPRGEACDRSAYGSISLPGSTWTAWCPSRGPEVLCQTLSSWAVPCQIFWKRNQGGEVCRQEPSLAAGPLTRGWCLAARKASCSFSLIRKEHNKEEFALLLIEKWAKWKNVEFSLTFIFSFDLERYHQFLIANPSTVGSSVKHSF